jgi:hypothetical protein
MSMVMVSSDSKNRLRAPHGSAQRTATAQRAGVRAIAFDDFVESFEPAHKPADRCGAR